VENIIILYIYPSRDDLSIERCHKATLGTNALQIWKGGGLGLGLSTRLVKFIIISEIYYAILFKDNNFSWIVTLLYSDLVKSNK